MIQYGSRIDIEEIIHEGEITKKVRHLREKVKVSSGQEEATEYLSWSQLVRDLRHSKRLVVDADKPDLLPAFVIDYPKTDRDGSYFIIKCWSELL